MVAAARARDLTQGEARDLVMAALDPSARKLPKLGFDFYADFEFPDFYKLAVTRDNPNGSVIVGHFGVNRNTGEVWELVVCERVTSVDLKDLQKSLRKRIAVSPRELRKQAGKGPCVR
jgi:hypothetical protein